MGSQAMVVRVSTVLLLGIDAIPVDVQVMVAPGKVGMQIVGLPDKDVAGCILQFTTRDWPCRPR